MIVLSINTPETSNVVPVDYVYQKGTLLRFGAHEFGVFGQAAHKAWEKDLILVEGDKVLVYVEGHCIKIYTV